KPPCGRAESMPKSIPKQCHVAIAAPARETNDAQLFAQERSMLQDQTDERSQLLHCHADLTAPATAMMPVFHGISRAEGPFKQTTKPDRLPHLPRRRSQPMKTAQLLTLALACTLTARADFSYTQTSSTAGRGWPAGAAVPTAT